MILFPINSYTISSLFASSFCIAMAILAFFKGGATREKNWFSFVSLSVGIWTFFPIATSITASPVSQTVLARLVYLAACLTPLGFLLLSGTLVNANNKTYTTLRKSSFILAGVFILLLPTPWFIAGVQSDGSFRAVRAGLFYHLYVGYFSVFFSYSFYELFRGIKATSGEKKNQLKYVLGAFFIGSLGGGIHFLAVYIHKEPFPHDVLVIAFVAILAYAVIKHRLMEVNLAARYGVIETMLGILVGLPIVGLTIWIDTKIFTSFVIISLVLLSTRYFKTLRSSLTKAVDRLPMFRGRYERFERLEALFSDISSTKTLVEWYETIKEVALIICPTDNIALLVKDEHAKRFIVRTSEGFDPATKIFLYIPTNSILATHLNKNRTLLLVENALASCTAEEKSQMERDLILMRSAICVPIFHTGTPYAIISLGEKPDKEAFNDLELTSLAALARAAEQQLRVILSGLAQEQTTSIWAHDLMKPFTLKGSFQYLEQMLEGSFGPLSADIQQAIKLILNDIGFVRQNLKQVLSPGQGDSFNISSTPLTGVYSRVRENYTIESIKRHFNWRVDVPPEDLRVFCDWSVIEHRVLANLIENAFRYTPSEGTVELGWRMTNDKFVGFVKDNGIGIRESDIPKLFKPHSQLEEGNKGFSGLGLFSAKSVIEAHNGKIWVESTFGKGATFFFELPLASAPHKKSYREDA